MDVCSSLNPYCSWGVILPLLGVRAPGGLPAQADCPICSKGQTLQVYRDTVPGGQWYWCGACGFAGDAIDLAARAWGLEHESAILKLATSGVAFPAGADQDLIARHLNQVARRRRVAALWQQARASREALRGSLAAFARRLGVPAVRPADWDDRGGRFIGVTCRNDVIRCFQPGQGFDGPHGHQTGGHRIFHGHGWDQLLAIPFHDLPGRVRGFLFIGRAAEDAADFLYRAVEINASCHEGPTHGLAMLDAIVAPHPEFGEGAFLTTDPVEAVRLQLAHLAEHGRPLPLVAAPPGHYPASWGMLPYQPVSVFGAAKELDEAARLIRHAVLADGMVADAAADTARPRDVLRAVAQSGRPWRAALEAQLLARPAAEAVELYRRVGLEGPASDRFLRDCPEAARAKLPAAAKVSRKSVMFAGDTIAEVDGTWWNSRTQELVSDLLVRVDRIVHMRRTGKVTYEGTMARKGRTIPFAVGQEILDRRPLAWWRDHCTRGGLGMPHFSFRKKLNPLVLAQLFHEPAFVESDGVLGWDDARNVFAFPTFLLTMNGTVAENAIPLEGNQPGLAFARPGGLTPEQVLAFSDEDESTQFFWAMAAAVVAQAVAPALGLAPGGVAVSGYGGRNVAEPAARALGCPIIGGDNRSTVLHRKVAELQAAACWPIFATSLNLGCNVSDRLVLDLAPGTVIAVSAWTADVLAIRGGWTVVEAPSVQASMLAVTRHGPAIVPNYLLRFCTNRPGGSDVGTDLVGVILDDMAEWLGEKGGNAYAVRRAAGLIREADPARCADRFADLTCRLVHEGYLVVGDPARVPKRPGTGKQPTVWAIGPVGNAQLHIPRPGIVQSLARHGTPFLDAATITGALASAGVLVDEREHEGCPGWVVSEGWWSAHRIRWEARHQQKLRKVN